MPMMVHGPSKGAPWFKGWDASVFRSPEGLNQSLLGCKNLESPRLGFGYLGGKMATSLGFWLKWTLKQCPIYKSKGLQLLVVKWRLKLSGTRPNDVTCLARNVGDVGPNHALWGDVGPATGRFLSTDPLVTVCK
ncbi:hypothetical protein AMTR_s00011p00199210 [Amborella trichopoda]|uniref:Uncharacterized protein n=1 Tax=Amborella trichopoda TaxID=13333 RepID=W1NFS0_AMBTC|nr:hypothetical protein AMTR_s00011p00199210 [Amborella trichopoda]